MSYFDRILNRTASLTDLQHLTIDQALADIAVFIHTAREHVFSERGKVDLIINKVRATKILQVYLLSRYFFLELVSSHLLKCCCYSYIWAK